MHDLDRTLQEYESGVDALEADGLELEGNWETELDSESDGEVVFDEIEEMELAATLLEVQDEAELDQFIGNLVKKGFRAVGKVARGPIGQALGGVLKKVARTALPMAGAALGNLIVPGAGGVVGGKLASMAGKMFGLELEGLSPQDQEFEVARRVVRLGGEAVKQATRVSPTGAPGDIAKNAILRAARKHAPGLVGGAAGVVAGRAFGNGGGPGLRSGRWFRRGRRIILVGV